MYIVGIDVGGTNTDAALVQHDQVLAMAKVPTNHGDLFASTQQALHEVLQNCPNPQAIKLRLSTTLSTNIILEEKGTPTAVVAIPGPGVNLANQEFPFPLYEVSGYIDHRGREVWPLDLEEIVSLKAKLQAGQGLAIVGKFSQRNPAQEQKLAELLGEKASTLSLGHLLTGRANFPRRIVTAYLNSSVAEQQAEFVKMWETVQREFDLPLQEILILKADGGTMSLPSSLTRPVETILSGPAASIMGVLAVAKCTKKNFLIVDIGGTTTDLAVVVENEVLFERSGAVISGQKTLVPALLTRSLGLGGDSELHFKPTGSKIKIEIGPRRAGIPVCCGGSKLTPTDAVVALGLSSYGDQKQAFAAFAKLGSTLKVSGKELASQVIQAFIDQLVGGIQALYAELENSPLYTISAVLNPPQIHPEAVVGLGAPAKVFIPLVATKLNLNYEVVPFSAGANAIGAAAAQPTIGLTLHADTELGIITVPELGYRKSLTRSLFFTLDQARDLAKQLTQEYAQKQGYSQIEEIYLVEEESFNVVRGFHTVGQVFMIRTQLRPRVQKIQGGLADA